MIKRLEYGSLEESEQQPAARLQAAGKLGQRRADLFLRAMDQGIPGEHSSQRLAGDAEPVGYAFPEGGARIGGAGVGEKRRYRVDTRDIDVLLVEVTGPVAWA